MPSKVFSAAVVGLEAQIIEVEVDVSQGLRRFSIVGLPDKAVEEAKERMGSAIKSIGLKPPHTQTQRVLVSLAPADLKKQGSIYDLSIALGYLLASKQIRFDPSRKILVGELALDGRLRPIKGALSFALSAQEKGWQEIVLPQANAAEAALIKGLKVIGTETLEQAVGYLQGQIDIKPFRPKRKQVPDLNHSWIDLAWIKGQQNAKRALEIAAAGAHNLLMEGPPGTGKTLLAQALASILPQLSFAESLEVSKIYSVTGLLSEKNPIVKTRPFRSPHHSISEAALIGGGNPCQPGEITLAHLGVLFLDELPEFHRDALESLRQPLEQGEISILRARQRLSFPAKFMLAAATNPCPCGWRNDPQRECTCSNSQIAKYGRKLSGPLMDRIDLFVDVPALKYERLASLDPEHSSARIRQRIVGARQIQKQRFAKEATNSEMRIEQINKFCQTGPDSQSLLKKFVNSGQLSARGYHRVLKLARTIADLDCSESILHQHISEALSYRIRERN